MSKSIRLMTNKAEAQFAKTIENQGKLYFFHPRAFKIPSGRYQPDFYVVEDACFYEVCGTRAAYSLQRKKIDEFREAYPKLRLEIANIGAWKNGPDLEDRRHRRVGAPKRPPRPVVARRTHGDIWGERTPLIDALRPLAEREGFRTVAELARGLAVSYSSLYAALVNPRLNGVYVARWLAKAKQEIPG